MHGFGGLLAEAGIDRSRVYVTNAPWSPAWLATLHPAAVLRAVGLEAQGRARGALRDDLRLAAAELRRVGGDA